MILKGPMERKEKRTGGLSSAIGPWGLSANLSIAKKPRIIKLLRAGDIAQSKALGLIPSKVKK